DCVNASAQHAVPPSLAQLASERSPMVSVALPVAQHAEQALRSDAHQQESMRPMSVGARVVGIGGVGLYWRQSGRLSGPLVCPGSCSSSALQTQYFSVALYEMPAYQYSAIESFPQPL